MNKDEEEFALEYLRLRQLYEAVRKLNRNEGTSPELVVEARIEIEDIIEDIKLIDGGYWEDAK